MNVALDVLKKADVSSAIFAPGWVWDTKQKPDFQTAQNRRWSLVEKSWVVSKFYPKAPPFYSNFDQVGIISTSVFEACGNVSFGTRKKLPLQQSILQCSVTSQLRLLKRKHIFLLPVHCKLSSSISSAAQVLKGSSKILSADIDWKLKNGSDSRFPGYNLYVKKLTKQATEDPGGRIQGFQDYTGAAYMDAFYF